MGFDAHSIERDRARFRDVVRGRVREDLKRYLSSSELIGRRAGRSISIPVPEVVLPRLRFGANESLGVGQGPGEEGEAVPGTPSQGDGAGPAGDGAAEHLLEVEVELEELAAMLAEELELPAIEPRGTSQLPASGARYTGLREHGPKGLRHTRRTFKRALVRSLSEGSWDPAHPRVLLLPEDERFRMRKQEPRPCSSACVFHVMDISGSMGREQKEMVRSQAFWIDTWLRSQYETVEIVYLVHDAAAKEVEEEEFFALRESGGTKISSAYELLLDVITSRYDPGQWNLYPFQYSDGDNWSARDTSRCIELLREGILPRVNQFCYGQVKSAYGSGQYLRDLRTGLAEHPGLVATAIDNREEIPEALRAFLGRGR